MSKLILCADDSNTMQTVAEITFRATEFEYVGALSADEALEKARANKPALVLADAVMPGKSGYELCRAIKADPQLSDVPVVMMCGNSQAYDAAQGGDVGAAGHVQKPWDSQVMLDKVTEILARPSAAKAAPAAQPKTVKPPAATPAAPAVEPPRTATIMGMPAIHLPPKKPALPSVPAAAPSVPAPRAPTPAPVAAANKDTLPKPPAGLERPPMIQAVATKKPTGQRKVRPMAVPDVARAVAQEAGLDPNGPEMGTLLKLSQAVVERIVWEIVPDLAETIIREHVKQRQG